jgi:hypothetical protein
MKKILLLPILVVLTVTLVAVQAQDSGYIQINNGSVIEIPAGQQPQVVVQFGNRGNEPLMGVRVVCTISESGQGSVSFVEDQIYPHSMQTYAISGSTISFPEDSAGIELIAGQNFNVGFNVRVEDTAEVGVIRTVTCELYDEDGVVDSAEVVIQTPGAEPITETPEMTPEATETPAPEKTEDPEITETPVLGTGDVQITLTWDNDYDLDLYVTEPSGELIYFGDLVSDTGGELDVDANYPCGENLFAVENVFWEEDEAPEGEYQVAVVIGDATCDELDEADWTLTVRVGGDVIFESSGEGIPGGSVYGDRVDVVTFRVEEDGSAVVLGLALDEDEQASEEDAEVEAEAEEDDK